MLPHTATEELEWVPPNFWSWLLSPICPGSNLQIARALNTPSPFPMKQLCAVVSYPVPQICGDSSCQHFFQNGTNFCVGFLPCILSKVVLPSRPFWNLDEMHPACSTNHGMTSELSLRGSCVLLFDMALDCSDNSTQQHYRVLNEPIRLFVSFHCVLRCNLHGNYTISERDYCRLCVALQRDFSTTKQVNDFHHSHGSSTPFFNATLLMMFRCMSYC